MSIVIVYGARPRLVGLALWVIARGAWSNTGIPAVNKKPVYITVQQLLIAKPDIR